MEEIRSASIGGNTVYYLRLSGGEAYYTVSAADYPEAVILDAGDQVELSYRETEGLLIGAEDFKLVSRKAEEPEREETQ